MNALLNSTSSSNGGSLKKKRSIKKWQRNWRDKTKRSPIWVEVRTITMKKSPGAKFSSGGDKLKRPSSLLVNNNVMKLQGKFTSTTSPTSGEAKLPGFLKFLKSQELKRKPLQQSHKQLHTGATRNHSLPASPSILANSSTLGRKLHVLVLVLNSKQNQKMPQGPLMHNTQIMTKLLHQKSFHLRLKRVKAQTLVLILQKNSEWNGDTTRLIYSTDCNP